MRCDLNCPYGEPYCCRACWASRRNIKDEYADKWSDKWGFWSPQGCKLGDDRPQECKDYDCKQFVFYSSTAYVDGEWKTVGLHEVKIEDRDKEFVDKYNKVFKDLKQCH
jgi:hypothetical protein